ncbi:HyaD/HybD family hydrogenase maturation endopeptidase [Ideonella sp. 4Y11]|uniref:HyaD/HybD family hydrogenase maturation endopeptidase n=1 Tax=Ideonella aquatica TaxID=2824119 RepID=A0A941BI41_9BURK|nr:HyaD/HybD family hydrogenase maturation endopeptidase [Ideonella aquatica]MBQ0957463.1 HyaD/HybD family hydrogenase maturation endopeptidase [Ideonella aquatica]
MNDLTSPGAPEPGCNAAGGTDETIVVLGIGNVLWADEGFGVRCVEALDARYRFAPHVRLVDGGTQGLYLIQHVQEATRLLILDAIDYGLAPGTLHQVENEEVPRFLGAKKMSLHQTGFQEVLMLAQLTERYPAQVLLIGCQPEQLEDYGGSLRPVVKAALEQAVHLAVERLRAWGADPQPRQAPPAESESVSVPTLSLAAYESGRPSADSACRVGDERFIMTAPERA